jgi:superfamily I DNA/RNA helicase
LTNNPRKQIGVFLPNYRLATELQDYVERNSNGNSQIYRNEFGIENEVDPCRPGLLITYLDNAKGLEFDSVFIPSLEKWHHQIDFETKMKLYVLSSRSRQDLHFSWVGSGEPSVLSVFPRDLLPVIQH